MLTVFQVKYNSDDIHQQVNISLVTGLRLDWLMFVKENQPIGLTVKIFGQQLLYWLTQNRVEFKKFYSLPIECPCSEMHWLKF